MLVVSLRRRSPAYINPVFFFWSITYIPFPKMTQLDLFPPLRGKNRLAIEHFTERALFDYVLRLVFDNAPNARFFALRMP